MIKRFKQKISAGAVNINECLIYMNTTLPFGGVGESGLGCYHGKYSFEQFSHFKPVMQVGTGSIAAFMNNQLT